MNSFFEGLLFFRVLTEAYYDVLAALPAVIPEGPIGILGLGAGTAARLIHHFWPAIHMHGWELDPGVVQAARNFFDLEELEWQGESYLLDKVCLRFLILDCLLNDPHFLKNTFSSHEGVCCRNVI